jgi:hypothetical protein
VSLPGPDRRGRRTLNLAQAAAKPVSTRQTFLKLIGGSLTLGLVLVSLDITPSYVLELLGDIGPLVQQLGRSLWRAAEILLGCLLAGAALILPAWLIHRAWAKRSRPAALAPKQPAPPAETKTTKAQPSLAPEKAVPVSNLP